MTRYRARLAFSLCISLAATAAAQDMIGISYANDVFRIDSATGEGTLVGPTGFPGGGGSTGSNSMLVAGNVVWIGYTRGGSTEFQMLHVPSGSATTTSTVNLDVRGLAYDSVQRRFYAVVDSGIGTGDSLYIVNPFNGFSALVGAMGSTTVQALAHDGSTLFAIGRNGLLTVDPATGAATDVNPSVQLSGGGQFLSVDGSGQLFYGRSELYTVDKVTGVGTLVGSGGYADVRGCDFVCPTTALGAGCPSGTSAPRLRLARCPTSPGILLTTVSGGPANALYGIALATRSGQVILPNGCTIWLGGNVALQIHSLDTAGQDQRSLLTIPFGFAGTRLALQALTFPGPAGGGIATTSGYEFVVR